MFSSNCALSVGSVVSRWALGTLRVKAEGMWWGLAAPSPSTLPRAHKGVLWDPPGMLDLHRLTAQDPLCHPKGPDTTPVLRVLLEHRGHREALLPKFNC